MTKDNITGQQITINNPSKLVLDIDAFLNQSNTLYNNGSEELILKQLSQRTTTKYPNILMFSIDLEKICDQINDKYQDGFYFEEENDRVQFPYHRTIRRKSSLVHEPSFEKDLSTTQITSIRVGKHAIIGENSVSLKKFNTSLLMISPSPKFEARAR